MMVDVAPSEVSPRRPLKQRWLRLLHTLKQRSVVRSRDLGTQVAAYATASVCPSDQQIQVFFRINNHPK